MTFKIKIINYLLYRLFGFTIFRSLSIYIKTVRRKVMLWFLTLSDTLTHPNYLEHLLKSRPIPVELWDFWNVLIRKYCYKLLTVVTVGKLFISDSTLFVSRTPTLIVSPYIVSDTVVLQVPTTVNKLFVNNSWWIHYPWNDLYGTPNLSCILYQEHEF